MVNVLLNDGQAKCKVSKLVGSWAVAENRAKIYVGKRQGSSNFQLGNLQHCFETSSTSFTHVIPRSLGPLQWFYLGRSSLEPLGVVSRQAVTLPGLKTIDMSTRVLPLV